MMQETKQQRESATRAALIRYIVALAILFGITGMSFFLVRGLIDEIRRTEVIVAQAADLRSEIHKTMLALDAVAAAASAESVLAAKSQAEVLRSNTDRLLLQLTNADVTDRVWNIVRDPERGLEPAVRMLVEHAAAAHISGAQVGGSMSAMHPTTESGPKHGGIPMHEAPRLGGPSEGTGGEPMPAMQHRESAMQGGTPMSGSVHNPTDGGAKPAAHNPVAMNAVDQLIETLREGARQEQERAAWLHDFLGYGTLLILIVEGMIVFRPLLKTAKVEGARADHVTHELEYLAAHDALTGLLNRGQIDRVLKVAVREAASVNQQLGLILLDLDEFKPINDRYGHAAGDKVLTHVAERIRLALRPGDICGRLGGDEFVVVLPHVEHEPEIKAVADRILKSVSEAVHFAGNDIVPGASIGYAMFPIAGGDVEALMSAADLAMYEAKRNGRGNVSEFSHRMRAEAERSRLTEAGLRRAFAAHEFEVHYQLIHEADEGVPIGVEALVRWRHPERGLLEPSEFLPDIRRSGRMEALTSIVLFEALAQFSVWRAAGYGLRALHVNVGEEFLKESSAHAELLRMIANSGLEPSDIVLEITEDVRFEDEGTRDVLTALAEYGLKIAVDDFGAGAISLSELGHPAIGIVKLDRQVVSAAANGGNGRPILLAVERLLRAMGKVIVAEGAETPEIEATFKSVGIEFLQGYHYGRPAPAAGITARLARREPGAHASVA